MGRCYRFRSSVRLGEDHLGAGDLGEILQSAEVTSTSADAWNPQGTPTVDQRRKSPQNASRKEKFDCEDRASFGSPCGR